jgi:Methyl-accepting chemotaxis protein
VEKISDNEILNAFSIVIPYLHTFLDNEASIAIADTQKYLKNSESTGLALNKVPGDPVPIGGAAHRSMKEGRTIIDFLPREMFGTAIKSYSIPIKGKDGSVEGCLVVAKSLKRREELLELSKGLSAALHEISEVTSDFSSKLQSIVEMNTETAKKIDEAHENVSSTDKIFSFINQVTSQTDLLGINASIEATRAGAEGRAFKVIAQEIRKLSETSRDSVSRIYSMLNAINKSVDDICTMTTRTQEITAEYTTAFTEIAASVENLSSNARHLEQMADKV